MPVAQLGHLAESLDQALAWRKKELLTVKALVSNVQEQEQHILTRAAVCLLYAHWEGFVVEATTTYIDHVASLGLPLRELAPSLIALDLRSEIQQAGRSRKPTIHTKLTERLISGPEEQFRGNWNSSEETRSNLNLERLCEILCLIGVDSTKYQENKYVLDSRLLGNRNVAAHGTHGAGFTMQTDDYIDLQERIVGLAELFRQDIEEAAAASTYLGVSPSV